MILHGIWLAMGSWVAWFGALAAIEDDSRLADIGPAPETVLVDARTEQPFRLADLQSQGKAALVSFVYTTCNGSCPATTHTMYRVQEELKRRGLWGDRVALVSISLDPKTDRPEILSRYAEIFGADPSGWHFLTGDPKPVAEVIAAWDMWARIGPSGTLDHPSRIFLVDPNGRQREIYNLQFLDPESVVADIQLVLDEASAGTR
ncbi:SCO family protein [Tautonia marina]|uniref:SCO family protein n=1 Tax=Tautonia marina TaxID=2653855 RepID=UPI0012611E48|nr:SCO family protein [Tautonia marina]